MTPTHACPLPPASLKPLLEVPTAPEACAPMRPCPCSLPETNLVSSAPQQALRLAQVCGHSRVCWQYKDGAGDPGSPGQGAPAGGQGSGQHPGTGKGPGCGPQPFSSWSPAITRGDRIRVLAAGHHMVFVFGSSVYVVAVNVGGPPHHINRSSQVTGHPIEANTPTCSLPVSSGQGLAGSWCRYNLSLGISESRHIQTANDGCLAKQPSVMPLELAGHTT